MKKPVLLALAAHTLAQFTALAHPVPRESTANPRKPGSSIALNDCDKDPLDTMFAAAAGCRRVVKITPDGQVTIALKAEPPWSPTGVALHGDDVYVLEYAHANSDKHEDWQPRVRKLGRDGSVKTLATLSKEWN